MNKTTQAIDIEPVTKRIGTGWPNTQIFVALQKKPDKPQGKTRLNGIF
jgi:hypothetical protein